MDTPLNFTMRYEDGTSDLSDHTGDVGAVGTFGTMWFEPTVLEGYRIPTTDGALTPRVFECVMEDGVLKTEAGGSADVRLWGNDPDWNLARYSYRVRADLADAAGNAIQWEPFEFDAPSIDAVRYLKDYMPKPGQKFGRGTPAHDVDDLSIDGENRFVFTRTDGFELPRVSADAAEDVVPAAKGRAIAFAIALG